MKTFLHQSWVFLRSIVTQFYQNNGFVLAGALSFFTLISSIPLAFLIISLLRWFLPQDYLPILTRILENFVVPTQMHGEVHQGLPIVTEIKLGFSFELLFQSLVSGGFLLWLGSLIFDIIERILAVTFHVKQKRSFWKSKLNHIVLMLFLGGLYVFLTLTTSLIQVIAKTSQNEVEPLYARLLQGIVVLDAFSVLFYTLMSIGVFFILYKASTPRKLHNKSYLLGALFAGLFWLITRYVFGLYIEKVNDFSLFFGAVAVMARIALWVFYSAVIFIIGAEVAYFFEKKIEQQEAAIEGS